MSLKQIKEKFYETHPQAIAYIVYNEKLGKHVCYSYNVANSSKKFLDRTKIENTMRNLKIDFASATIYYINENCPNLCEHFSDFYHEFCIEKMKQFSSLEEFCSAFESYLNNFQKEDNSSTSKPKIYAYIINDNGEIEETIFDMELTIKSNSRGNKTCIIENTFTEDKYKCAGIHGMGIKFLEAVLAEKNIHIIEGESKECDVYESSNNSSLVEHYKKLGFDIDYEDDGSYKITKYVNPEQVLDISKPDTIKTK